MTEVWIRNPQNYVREAVEAEHFRWAWDFGFLLKRNVDVNRFADVYATGRNWRQLAIGTSEQGAIELAPGFTLARPKAIHPVWQYGEKESVLKKLVASDQYERVVITDIPNTHMKPGKAFIKQLALLQEDFPNAVIHIHGLYGYSAMFSNGFGAADVDPRTDASMGKVNLPNGKKVIFEEAPRAWVNLLNMRESDLSVPRNRCIYNIKSAVWAGKHFNDVPRFQTAFKADQVVDHEAVSEAIPENNQVFIKKN